MIIYNYSAEYAALIIIVAILFSFSSHHDTETIEYSFIKTMYKVALVNTLVTIAAIVSGAPGSGLLHTALAYGCNIVYFIVTPSVSLCFLVYTKLVTVIKYDRLHYKQKIRAVCIPYCIYLVVLAVAGLAGKVFTFNETVGYVRLEWYQLPYIIVAINLIYAIIIIVKNIKIIPRELRQAIAATTILATIFLYVQLMSGTTIITGITHTACILSLHLQALNVKKNADNLTGVYNRMYLIHSLQVLVDQKTPCSLYVFSLRGMKNINERFGIEYGDRVLVRIARILSTHTSDGSVFRYGGDEFSLLLNHKHKNHQGSIDAIVAELDKPQSIDGNEVLIDFIYTRVDYDLFGDNVRALISAVDFSLSSLKTTAYSKHYIYDTTVVKELIKRANMVQQIKDALDGNMFEIHYQPIYCHATKTFTQAEALVRMRNEDGYLVYPGDFIDLAVKTGLIVQMTYMILDRVCCDLRYMMDHCNQGFTVEAVSVNFPYLQFTDNAMEQKVLDILNDYQIPPSMIKIEITEREMIADTDLVKTIMLSMNQQGFGFELDDFGMDYSNMSVVLDLPMDCIKLDRSFLLAAMENPGKMKFFRHLTTGILDIGSTIICEGVEEQAQLDFVLSCGCQYIQGYFFSKPLDRDTLLAFLRKSAED